MPYDVKLPDIGEGVAEGEIVRWLVRIGDRVREDQPLVEVMTDKASVEIPSPRSGVVAARHVEEGQVVNVGTVLVSIDVEGEAAATSRPAAPTSAREAPDDDAMRWNNEGGSVPMTGMAGAATGAPAPPRVQATPAVRQLAKQLGVALEAITGSGPGGTITASDIQRAASGGASTPAPRAGAAPAPSPRPAAATTAPPAAGAEERIPLRGLRRRIAENMRRALDTAAHFTFVAECDFTAVVAHRAGLSAEAEASGIRLTFLPYVVRALVGSLREFPMLNASLDDEAGEIVVKRAIHVGIAVHTREGLTVPVIHDADRRTLLELASEIDRLAEGARAGKLKLEELQGGTITVTSTGSRGGVLATPIIYHPQVAILGVHEIRPRPAVRDGQIVVRELGNLSLSLDHRVVDGAVGADFLYDLIRRVEHPEHLST